MRSLLTRLLSAQKLAAMPRKPGLGEGNLRRRAAAQQLGRIGHHVLRRGRLVVADVVDAVHGVLVDGRRQHAGDVVDVDAVEHLARLDDAPRRAGPQVVDHAAAGPVDAGQAEHLDAPAGLVGRNRARRARPAGAAGCARRRAGRRLVSSTHCALPVAVHADRRQVADPGEVGQRREIVAEMAQHDVAFEVGRNADQHVRGALQQRPHLGRGVIALELGELQAAQRRASGRLVRVPAIAMSRALRWCASPSAE